MFHMKRFAFSVLALMLIAGCASVSRDLVTGNKKAFGYDWNQQVQIGQSSDPQILAQFGLYDDEALSRYVNEVGQRVLAQSHLRRAEAPAEVRNTPFTFRVLDSPVVNAFALPGGFVYVTRGLLAHCENEAQLAMVLGHEITHIARQHAARQAYEAQRSQYLLLGGALLGQTLLGGSAAENILGLGGQAAQLLLLKYGREDERESDRWGTEYAALAGYAVEEGAEFFNVLSRIQAESGRALPTWQSSHPDPGERSQTIRQLAEEWRSRAQTTKVGTEEMMAQLEGVVFGENPRNGYVESGTFLHPELKFQFDLPSGYQVSNEASRVAIVEGNGRAYLLLEFAQEQSAQAAARAFGSQEGFQVADSGTDRFNGMSAAFVLGQAQTEQGPLALLAYFIEYGGRVYRIMGITTVQAYDTHRPQFLALIRSFRTLTDRRALEVQPARIDVVQVPRATSFQSLLPATLPFKITAQDLAIANQVSVNETIPAGKRIKIVR